MPSRCNFTEGDFKCNKDAIYSLPDKKGRVRCAQHKTQDMVNNRKDSRVCQHEDHKNEDKQPRASFNFPTEKKPLYCITHSEPGMVNLNNLNIKCVVCKLKQPSFGENNKATHCSTCKTTNMIDLVSNLCEENECKTNATRGFPGEKAKRCKKHALQGMVDVKNKKCTVCIETKVDKPTQATYGVNKPTHCLKHKLDGMKDMRHTTEMCEVCNETRASYGINKPTRCVTHKTDDMKDLVSIMCEKCHKHQCNFNYRHEKKGRFCNTCKLDGMVDVVNPKCKSCNLFSVSGKKDKLCSYCSPASSNYQKTREMIVVNFLTECKFDFIHNKSVGFVCGNYRPDIRIDAGTHLVIVEIDEDQHQEYAEECEIARMNNIAQAEGLRCVFLRYNPDTFKVKGETVKIYKKTRLEELEKQIRYHMEHIPNEAVTVYRMFYDNDSGEHVVMYDIVSKIKHMYEDEKAE